MKQNRLQHLLKTPALKTSKLKFTAEELGRPVVELTSIKIPLKHILVPIDFSKTSKKALEYAIPLAKQFNAKIALIHVIYPSSYPSEEGFVTPPLTLLLNTQKKILQEFAKQKVPGNLLEETMVCIGQPFREIVDIAKKKTDLIIITTHGYSGLKRAWLGSTAERVVRYAPCPVLTVHEKEHDFV
jgi:universal stress protein A